jgi:hypothetical protein
MLLLVMSTSVGRPADRRLDNALAEIATLKQIVAEQDRRITALEQLVKPPQGGSVPNERPPLSPSLVFGWKTASAWKRVKEGMSESQVVAILGIPTRVERGSTYDTLFYQGEVLGSGSIAGLVRLLDGQVYRISPPIF